MLKIIFKRYKKTISPLLKHLFSGGCRFEPTCSEYVYRALLKHGLVKGGFFAIVRIVKCNPFYHGSNYDPI